MFLVRVGHLERLDSRALEYDIPAARCLQSVSLEVQRPSFRTTRSGCHRGASLRMTRYQSPPATRAGADAEVAGPHVGRNAPSGSPDMDLWLLRSCRAGCLVDVGGVRAFAMYRGRVRPQLRDVLEPIRQSLGGSLGAGDPQQRDAATGLGHGHGPRRAEVRDEHSVGGPAPGGRALRAQARWRGADRGASRAVPSRRAEALLLEERQAGPRPRVPGPRCSRLPGDERISPACRPVEGGVLLGPARRSRSYTR